MEDILNAILKEIEMKEVHEQVKFDFEGNYKKENSKERKQPISAAALFARQEKVNCAFCLQEHNHSDFNKVTNISERKQLIRKYG